MVVWNDNTGIVFGEGSDDSSAAVFGPGNDSAGLEIYTVLLLDLSDSVVHSEDVMVSMIAGARAMVQTLVQDQAGDFRHHLALRGFGAPPAAADDEILLDFTRDAATLDATLERLASTSEGRGTTDLYGAYERALEMLSRQGIESEGPVHRFLLLATDGPHEAGDEEAAREAALNAKHLTPVTIYVVGLEDDYDACVLEELAGQGAVAPGIGCREGDDCDEYAPVPTRCREWFPAGLVEDLETEMRAAAEQMTSVIGGNYSIGICTPVARGEASVTVDITVGERDTTFTLPYAAEALSGALSECDADALQAARVTCDAEGVCTIP